MSKVRRTTTEVQEVEAPQKEAPPTLADFDLWDYLETLKDEDFVHGSLTKRKFYVSQIEPSVTKAEGEPGYAKIFSSRFGPDDIKALNPQAIRWRVIEKIMGMPGTRNMWFLAMMPDKVQAPGATQAAGITTSTEMGNAFKEVVELAKDKNSIQRETMHESMGILSTAYKQGLELMPKAGSIADELTKLKTAGLLKTGDEGGLNLASVKELLAWGIPLLKEAGIFHGPGAPSDPKKDLDRVLDLLDVVETRLGKGGKGDSGVWPIVIQTFGPSLLKSVETITANIADIFRAQKGLSGTTAPAVSAPAVSTDLSQPAQAVTQPAKTTTQQGSEISPQDYIKMRLVALCLEELKEENPDAENIANWLEMTAPQLAELLAKTPADGVMNFLNTDAILKEIGDTEKANALKKAVLAELVQDMETAPVQ